MDIEKEVRNIVGIVLRVDEDQLTRETRFVEDLFIKSIQVVELVAMTGFKFGIDIPLKDARNNKTVGHLIDYIAARIKKMTGPGVT